MEEPLYTEQMLMDAVNILLETINEEPIEDPEDYDNIIEARQARSKVVEVKRAVLSEEWDFNRDENFTFPLTVDNEVVVPTNVLDITANNADVIMRNWKLYSKSNQSYVFEEEVPATVVWDLDFNSITHPLRHYITIRASRIFQARRIGDEKALRYNAVDEQSALLAARRSESRTGQYNMLTSDYGIDNRVRS